MPKEDHIKFHGEVLTELPSARFKIKLDNGHEIEARVAGRLRRNHIRVLLGDNVEVAMTPYDLTKGIITQRLSILDKKTQ